MAASWLADWAESCDLPVETAEQIIARALHPDYGRRLAQVEGCGGCSHPIRLKGTVWGADGTVRYSTTGEPDRVLLKRCGNRRQSVCPACSFLYRGDTWQLLCAGLAGGRKGIPETVAEHPIVFATLTAPSFGPVHAAHSGRCRPRRDKPTHNNGQPRSRTVNRGQAKEQVRTSLRVNRPVKKTLQAYSKHLPRVT